MCFPRSLSPVYKIFYPWLNCRAIRTWLYMGFLTMPLIVAVMCTGHVYMCAYACDVGVYLQYSSEGAGSQTLVNQTIIWRPGEDSQQPLTVCLPERPTRLFLLHLQGSAGKKGVCVCVCVCVCVSAWVCTSTCVQVESCVCVKVALL